jgi:rhomboid protease GluP
MKFFTDLPAGSRNLFGIFATFFVSLIAIYIILFVMPKAAEALMLDPAKLFSGEFWRLFTYQFVHNTLPHLIENITALFLSVMIAVELKTDFSGYSLTYFSSGILAILPIWLLFPFLALGASTAVYGSFGFLIRAAKRFNINPYVLLAAVSGLTLISTVYNHYSSQGASLIITIQQFAAHLSGLFFGYYFCLLLIRMNQKSKKLACLRSME